MPIEVPASDNRFRTVKLVNAAAPGTPPAGELVVYGKADKTLAVKDEDGVETVLGAGGADALDDLTDVNAPTPGDGEVLTWDDGAGEWVAAALPGGATFDAFGPTAEYRPDRPPTSPSSIDDEFDDGSVDAAWSAWSGATDPGTTDETTYPGKLYIVASNAVSVPTFMTRAFTPGAGVAFTIAMKVALAGEAWENHSFQFGIGACSAAATIIDEARIVASDGTNGQAFMRLYDSTGAGATRSVNSIGYSRFIYLAIGRDTSNVYTCWWSIDGYQWMKLTTGASDATAVTHVGFNIAVNATGGDRRVLVDWFRHIAAAPSAAMKFGS